MLPPQRYHHTTEEHHEGAFALCKASIDSQGHDCRQILARPPWNGPKLGDGVGVWRATSCVLFELAL
jgi:hypothetical protein